GRRPYRFRRRWRGRSLAAHAGYSSSHCPHLESKHNAPELHTNRGCFGKMLNKNNVPFLSSHVKSDLEVQTIKRITGMSTHDWHLAQINIGRMAAPLDSPIMAEFMNNLDRINALAEASPGFVWRLTGDGNNATSLRPYEDERIIVNMSVWKSVDDLK